MNDTLPLITILIATKDRASDLRISLPEIRKQRYPALEMLVIDDGSQTPIEPIVSEAWPGATVVRHETSVGQCARRNEGFLLAKGEYILQLDDDCNLTGPDDISYALGLMRQHPKAGAIACYMVNSSILPASIETSSLQFGCVASFVGAAVFFRTDALRQTSGYRPFFRNEWEEEELGLQLLGAGWQVLFAPRIVAHHRLSPQNRNSARAWMRGLRNSVWTIAIHIPFPRLLLEAGWKLTVGGWDAIRLMRPGRYLRGVFEILAGLPRVWQLRRALSANGLRRYDALRLRPVIGLDEFENPPAVTFETVAGFWRRWRNRPRIRNSWDRGTGDLGSSYTVAYAHEESLKNAPAQPNVKGEL